MEMPHERIVTTILHKGKIDSMLESRIFNTDGYIYKISREDFKKNQSLFIDSPGIYILICKTENIDNKNSIYIGETGDISKRLTEHIKEYESEESNNPDKIPSKFYWHTAIIFINNNLNMAIRRYIEYELIDKAYKAKRYILLNSNKGIKKTLNEKTDELKSKELLVNMQLLVECLGHTIFTPLTYREKSAYLYIKRPNKINAVGEETAEGFVVHAGSIISNIVKSSERVQKLRQIHDLVIDENFKRIDNILFASPSAASSFVCGYDCNGLITWCDENNITLKDRNVKLMES